MEKKHKSVYFGGLAITTIMAILPVPMLLDGAIHSDVAFSPSDEPSIDIENAMYTFTLQPNISDSSTGTNNPIL